MNSKLLKASQLGNWDSHHCAHNNGPPPPPKKKKKKKRNFLDPFVSIILTSLEKKLVIQSIRVFRS